jgi:signal peptidase I
MSPTLEEGHIYWVNRLAYVRQSPQRGDIVCLWTGKERLVKRVIGLPSDELHISHGVLFVNNRPLSEPYLIERGEWNIGAGTVGNNRYAVVGDNRNCSRGVQDALIVHQDRILGKLFETSPAKRCFFIPNQTE